MTKPKQFLLQIPEYYLLVLVLLAGYTPPFSFHPIAIGLAAMVILQIVLKNKVSGIVMGAAFFLVNFLMLLPLISELSEFTAFTGQAISLLAGGMAIWLVNLTLSLLMIVKYKTVEKFTKTGFA